MNEEQKLIRLADLTLSEYEANKNFVSSWSKKDADKGPARIVWFIPQVKNILAGGVRTIFSIAETFSVKFGTSHYFVIDDFKEKVDADILAKLFVNIGLHFPKIKPIAVLRHRRGEDVALLPTADFGIATLWSTAYLLAKYNQCKKKIYLVQDDESLFYPAGTMSSIINETYRIGLECVCNTYAVKAILEHNFEGESYFCSFEPGVDRSIFYPLERAELKPPYQIVFYGRTKNTRNCFVLAAEILCKVKERLGTDVIINSVGEDWIKEFPEYPSRGINCLGRLDSMEAVAKLYRESHLGLCFMATPHCSYQPLEYMASGCVPVYLDIACDLQRSPGLNVPANVELAAEGIIKLLRDTKEYFIQRNYGFGEKATHSWQDGIDQALEAINTP